MRARTSDFRVKFETTKTTNRIQKVQDSTKRSVAQKTLEQGLTETRKTLLTVIKNHMGLSWSNQ